MDYRPFMCNRLELECGHQSPFSLFGLDLAGLISKNTENMDVEMFTFSPQSDQTNLDCLDYGKEVLVIQDWLFSDLFSAAQQYFTYFSCFCRNKTNWTFFCSFVFHLHLALTDEGLKSVPVNVSVQGLTPANRFEVPKSEIFRTPL